MSAEAYARNEPTWQFSVRPVVAEYYRWRAWYAHITLFMLALAWLAATRAGAVKGEPRPVTPA